MISLSSCAGSKLSEQHMVVVAGALLHCSR
jgi:hypothetical protein